MKELILVFFVYLGPIVQFEESIITVRMPGARARLACLHLRQCGSIVWEISFPAALCMVQPPHPAQ